MCSGFRLNIDGIDEMQYTNKIDSFPVTNGMLSKALVKDSAGPTPFGFDFGPGPTLIVSEAFNAGKGATSSYSIGAGGMLTTVSPSVDAMQIAPCCANFTSGPMPRMSPLMGWR